MEEYLEAEAFTDAEIDAAWDEEYEETAETDEEDFEPEADQPAGEPAQAKQMPGRPKQDAPGGGSGADQPLAFTLKHLGEMRTVGRDEVVKLAQQGMDYARIRTERDQLREYRKEADPAFSLLTSYAGKSGMNVNQYIDYVRKQELMRSGMNEQAAAAQVSVEKQLAAFRTQQAGRREQEQQRQARLASMSRFMEAYPAVKPEEVPKEVWARVLHGTDLTAAYTMHRNRQLETELAAERQNWENAKKSTGSMSTKGTGIQDEIDRWWNEE